MTKPVTAPSAADTAAAREAEIRKDAALVSFEDDDAPLPRPRFRHFTNSDGSVGYEPIEG